MVPAVNGVLGVDVVNKEDECRWVLFRAAYTAGLSVSVRVRVSSFGDFEDLDVLAGGGVGCRAFGIAGSKESGSFQR